MASWKKYFKSANIPSSSSPISGTKAIDGAYRNWQSQLPEIYLGHPNRLERYNQYEQMDMDSDVSAALDIIAEFCTQKNEQNNSVFNIFFKETPSDHEVNIIKEQLQQWIALNEFNQRAFKLFRNVLKYGDQVFIRDPETFKLFWTEMSKVTKVIVNESDGKKPEQYIIKDINPNFQNLTITAVSTSDTYVNHPQVGGPSGAYVQPRVPYSGGTRFSHAQNEAAINAEHVMHLSLTEGLDIFWPFGNSVLETVFKVFKQKELLEDAIIIYRVQRAPERRVFKIDVGNMPSHMAMAFVERIKNEINQRRVPTQTGGGCFDMNTQVPLLDGRTLTLTELAAEYQSGKANWAFSCNPVTGEMVPGKISWAGITKRDTQVIKLTLDNGQEIICTPEHKFPILGRGKVEAKDIIPNQDSLISFNTRLYSINEKSKNNKRDPQYQQVFCHESKEWKFVHRTVANFMKEKDLHSTLIWEHSKNPNANKSVIHHLDFNKYNNNPENLTFMSGYDHFMLHSTHGKEFRSTLTQEQKDYIANKQRETIKNWSPEKKEARRKITSQSSIKFWQNLKLDTEAYQARKQLLLQNLAEQQAKPFPNQCFVWNNRMFEIVCAFMRYRLSKQELINALNADSEFINLYRELNRFNPTQVLKFDNQQLSKFTLEKIITGNGYAGWREFLNTFKHKIKRTNRRIQFTPELWSMVITTVTENGPTLPAVVDALVQDSEFMTNFGYLNANIKGNAQPNKFTQQTLKTCLANAGYKGWTDFVEKIPQFNHKVVSIEWLDQTQDVGTLTIDGHEELHDYHTFAIAQGVYTFNSNMMDATYNPMSTMEDYFFPVTEGGRGSSVEIMQGGQNLGEITDLRFFSNKLFRGLRIPSSYMPTGDDDSAQAYNNGRTGTALIQEWKFNQYCKRLQNMIIDKLDQEFKMFMRWRGINIDSQIFELQFNEPQNFAQYSQADVDATRIATFTQLEAVPYLSKRFLMKRYLGLTEQELNENEQLWKEEHEDAGTTAAPVDLRSVGVSPGGIVQDLEMTAPELGNEELGAAEGPAAEAPTPEAPIPASAPAGPVEI